MDDKEMTTDLGKGEKDAAEGISKVMDGAPLPQEENAPQTNLDEPSEDPSEPPENPEEQDPDAPIRNRYADLMNKRGRRIPKPVKMGLAVLVIAGLFAGGFYLVHKTGEEPEILNEKTAFAARGYLETYIEGSGAVAARIQVELGKELKGKVSEVLVQAGQPVKAGDRLLVVEPTEVREQLSDAQKDMVEARRSLEEASSEVSAAQKNVAELTTTAPFSGRIIPPEEAKTWHVGDELASGTELGTLVDDTVMKLPLYFSYAYINDIQPGAAANVSIPVNMSTVTGSVESVEPIEKISDDGTRMFRATIALQNVGALKKGMAATAEVMTATAGNVMPAETGLLEYSREETITTKQSGKITRLEGLDYYRFNAGQVIVQQQSDELSRAVESASRTLQTQQEIIVQKQKNITELENIIRNSVVTSPIDGVVLTMDTAVDAELAGGTSPCVVADMSSLVVKAEVSMNDIESVMTGQPATVTKYTDTGDEQFTGTVESVSMQANQDSSGGGGGNGGMATYTAVIALDPLPEGTSIAMGMYVNYQITTAQSEDCVTIPTQALVNTEEGTAVFAKPLDGQEFESTMPIPEGVEDIPEGFLLVPVAVGISDSTNVEILSGIEEGTEVFLSGPQDMYEDMNGGEGVVMVG